VLTAVLVVGVRGCERLIASICFWTTEFQTLVLCLHGCRARVAELAQQGHRGVSPPHPGDPVPAPELCLYAQPVLNKEQMSLLAAYLQERAGAWPGLHILVMVERGLASCQLYVYVSHGVLQHGGLHGAWPGP
jgi:hypothetical protein